MIIKNHVDNSTLLFQLQSKFNNEIKTKLDTKTTVETILLLDLINKTNVILINLYVVKLIINDYD